MKCWLASFPRSGNTFFRNILYYVYGLESSTWHKESDYPVDEDYSEFPFVKTHLLPDDLEPSDQGIPAIYLVRDGRDAMVSIAHHRSDIVNPGSDFEMNLREAIVAAEGSFFGGWSENVLKWLERADLIIRFEDLVKNPIEQFKRVEALLPMPSANWDNLPDFSEMKFGNPKYGGQTTSKRIKISPQEFSKRFFRKGKAGSWKVDMPADMLDLFWRKHGHVMDRLGYSDGPGSIGQKYILDGLVMRKMGFIEENKGQSETLRILVEATKLQISKNDGIKRYLVQLLKGLNDVKKYGSDSFEIDILINRKIIPLDEYFLHVRSSVADVKEYEKGLLKIKNLIKKTLPIRVYEPLAGIYRRSNIRSFLRDAKGIVVKKEEKELLEKIGSHENKYDLIHLPLPQNYRFINKIQSKLLVTVHDITHRKWPQFHTLENIKLSEEGFRFCKENAVHFISISDHTTMDLIENYGISSDKISTVYQAADSELFFSNYNTSLAKEVREKYKIFSNQFFLCLSTIEPRKNLMNTIKGFALFKEKHPDADAKLVISGEKGWKSNPLWKELEKFKADVILTGFVEDRDLHVLYSESLAFIYLSFYEGFGLPPLEAMSCKTAVIHSNLTSLKEVVADAGLIADPESPVDIAQKMKKLFFDKELRRELEDNGFNQSIRFNCRRSILETLKVYKNCLK